MKFAEFKNLLVERICQPTGTGNTLAACCPAHDDKRASLSVSIGADDRILVCCHTGCSPQDICASLGITLADLFISNRKGGAKKIVEAYPYPDADGNVLFEVVRFTPKDFRQRRPDANALGGWTWSTKGVKRVLFRLPELLREIKAGRPVYVAEGEKDVLALVKHGFAATCNSGGAGKWLDTYTETLRRADVIILADKDKAGREHAAAVAQKLSDVAAMVRVIECPDTNDKAVKDAADYFAAGGTAADLDELARSTLPFVPPAGSPTTDDLQRAIADNRPKIRLPGPDRLLSDFAGEIVEVVREKDIFHRNGEIVVLAEGELKVMTPQAFRCWAEKFFIGYRAKTIGENSFQFDVTMSDNEARGTLAAPQFRDRLRRVRRVNRTRLPIIGKDGKLTMLPDGYHQETETLTLSDTNYDQATPLTVAVGTINGLLAEFRFADGERSKAVAVAGMVSVFAAQLLPEKSLRPCFIFIANAEGAGKTLLAQICIVPTLGAMPISSKADDDDEMRKALITAIREALLVLFFDNIKGRLSSEPLEAFLSAPVYGGRKLGVNENVTGDNVTTVFCTGNGMTVSPDMRRRSLFCELHLEVERAEDRKFSRVLDVPTLLIMRPMVLAALWAMVRHWDANGRPAPSRGHSAFPTWANIVGGIVEAAGFSCPLTTANVTAAADPDCEDMRLLVKEMASNPAPLPFADLVKLAHEHGLFANIIGEAGDDLGRREKSAFARLLMRYDRRLVLDWHFIVEGQGRTRRYKVESRHGDMV